jgi:hypothetical protein
MYLQVVSIVNMTEAPGKALSGRLFTAPLLPAWPPQLRAKALPGFVVLRLIEFQKWGQNGDKLKIIDEAQRKTAQANIA